MKKLMAITIVLLVAARTACAASVAIPVGADGHYRMQGAINGVPVSFLVDTGASSVSVSEELAMRANLVGGAPIRLWTAAGVRTGRLVAGVGLSAGPFHLSNVTVAVSPGLPGDEALLGQSFLRGFVVVMDGAQMILREKQPRAGASDEQQLAYLRWLGEMSQRLRPRVPDEPTRKELLQAVWYEARRAGLDVSLVLAVIDTSSGFQRLHIQPKLRHEVTRLRHDLDQSHGNVNGALALYLADSRQLRPGSPELRRAVNGVLWARRGWVFNDPAARS
ncbi:clan AA aspartic protease, TIGR02281 family [Variovorax sp. HW608]|uniref:retropepsin-like aspartic protease family protein n=1 Tax=Variovorax sp. HW608 TaxID=1034889 RepID=UPI0008200142|nr:retropepsin-like aspartic protease [Variovorax sp. HW608]SCK13015.1 clan AA aspartic protease, TIGR02281 family [Variovorax sp. HW608]